jgi:hypothetical protein
MRRVKGRLRQGRREEGRRREYRFYLFGSALDGPKALCFMRVLMTLRVTVPHSTLPSRSSTGWTSVMLSFERMSDTGQGC